MSLNDQDPVVTQAMIDRGMKNRREVLGDAYVDKALERARANPMLRPLQENVTALAWGALWDRPGLSRKLRSLATVSMLIALNRPHELATHLRGALNNGWTVEELTEVMLHAAGYCGWPAAVDAFRVAAEVFETVSAETAGSAKG